MRPADLVVAMAPREPDEVRAEATLLFLDNEARRRVSKEDVLDSLRKLRAWGERNSEVQAELRVIEAWEAWEALAPARAEAALAYEAGKGGWPFPQPGDDERREREGAQRESYVGRDWRRYRHVPGVLCQSWCDGGHLLTKAEREDRARSR